MRDPKERLLDMLDAIERIEKYVSKGRAAFEQDELIQTWVVHHLQIVGEAAANIFSWSDPAPTRPRHLTPIFLKSQFPWQKWPFKAPKRPLFYTFFFHFRCLAWSDPDPTAPSCDLRPVTSSL